MSKFKHWLLGLVAALISGGAGAIASGTTLVVFDPDKFNFALQLSHTLKVMGAMFVFHGIIGCAAYLKQSPMPREVWTADERNGGN